MIDLERLTQARVLIVKLSSIGDVVQALPVATALRRRFPRARITWVVEDWTAPLVVGHRAIDRVIVFPRMGGIPVSWRWLRTFRAATRALRSEPYDVAVDLQGLLKSSVVALLSRARWRIGTPYQREGARWVSRPVPRRPGRVHIVYQYLRAAEFLGASAEPVIFDTPVQPDAMNAVARLLACMNLGSRALITVNPSASTPTRSWPIAQWAQVVDALADAGTVVLVGSRDQVARHAEVSMRARRTPYDLTGRTTLAELVALLSRSAIHIAPDTGSAHIAAALGRPVVGLYGPTFPWRVSPYGQAQFVVYHGERCGLGCPQWCVRRRCLRAAAPDEVVAQARRALATACCPPTRAPCA